MVGRRRQFDEEDVVSAAAAVFRNRGYAATSVDDLVAATGVHRASLYAVFASKRGLFLRVLDTLGDADPTERLDAILTGLHELAADDPVVRERIQSLVRAFGITGEQLGGRLLTRAGVRAKRGQKRT